LIEYALNRNLAKHFDDLLEWSNGRLYDLIARYLRKFDVWNIKGDYPRDLHRQRSRGDPDGPHPRRRNSTSGRSIGWSRSTRSMT